ncbi:MAG: hypothetical protein DWQ05_12575 [Calditrichaeota bacterium]|nr:MAG: hypothetical protein DWQ05_12575 [Calditrichota bacterium]
MSHDFITQFQINQESRANAGYSPEIYLQNWRTLFSRLAKDRKLLSHHLINQLSATLSFSKANLHSGLHTIFSGFSRTKLSGLAAEIMPDPLKIAIVASGNIPGVAVAPAVQLAAVGCPVIVKMAGAEQILLPWLLENYEQNFGPAGISCDYWPSDSSEFKELMVQAEKIIAFGSDETIRSLKHGFGRKVVGFGHKISIGLYDSPEINHAVLAQSAKDVVLFEQAGCLSPQLYFVCGTMSEIQNFAAAFYQNLTEMISKLGAPTIDSQLAFRRHALLDELDLAGEIYFSDRSKSCIVTTSDCLKIDRIIGPHVIQIVQFKTELDLQNELKKIKPWLQGSSLFCPPSKLPEYYEILRQAGCTYFAKPGQMQGPDLLWKNGGFDLVKRVVQQD